MADNHCSLVYTIGLGMTVNVCMWLQACKDKRGVLQESLDKVKLSYSQITAQTTEMTQQVFHMTSHVRSQVNATVLSHHGAEDHPIWYLMHCVVHFAAAAGRIADIL